MNRTSRHRAFWPILLLGLTGVVLLLQREEPDALGRLDPAAVTPAPESLSERPGSRQDTTPRPARTEVRPPEAPPPDSRSAADTARLIEERNDQARQHLEGFLESGWTIADAPAPDPDLLALDPSLLGPREAELRHQLLSSSLRSDQLENARLIAAEATDPLTRAAAIDALGRRHAPEAQQMLLDLFDSTDDPADQRLILGLLKPAGWDDPTTLWLLDKLHSPELPLAFRRQISFSLSVLANRLEPFPGEDPPFDLLDRVDPKWHDLLTSTQEALTGETAAADPAHSQLHREMDRDDPP